MSRHLNFAKRGLLATHLPLVLTAGEEGGNPITEIIVGPSRHKEVSAQSVKSLLQKLNLDIPASASAIPFQTT